MKLGVVYLKKAFVGLIRDHRTRIGIIKAKRPSTHGGESKDKDYEGE